MDDTPNISDDYDIFIKNIGNRIVVLRKEKNMTQIELSIICNIEDSALRRIEKGRTNPTIKTLLIISSGLNVTLIELLSF